MPPATLWAPRADGIRASIWEPGGPIAAGSCSLAELAAIVDDDYLFLDNFTAADGTVLLDHIPDVPGVGGWHFGDEILEILAGAVVNPLVSSSETETSPTFEIITNSGVGLNVGFGAFSEENFSVLVEWTTNFNTITLTITCVAGVITAVGAIAGYANVTTEPITLDFCTWYNLRLSWETGTSTLTLNDGAGTTESVVGDPTTISGINTFMDLTIENVEENGARVAHIYVDYTPAA